MKNPFKSIKGEGMIDFAVGGVIGFIILAVILYVSVPILSGVSTSVSPANASASWGYPIAGAYSNSTNSIAAGINLMAISEIVVPAVVILGVLMIGLLHKK